MEINIDQLRVWDSSEYKGLNSAQNRQAALDNPERYGIDPTDWASLDKIAKLLWSTEVVRGLDVVRRAEATDDELRQHLESKLSELIQEAQEHQKARDATKQALEKAREALQQSRELEDGEEVPSA